MLVFGRREGESIRIGDDIKMTVAEKLDENLFDSKVA